MSKFIIVGGGASGLVAAINLKRQNNEVIILEKNDKCGKKILATGNGRCNYFNSDQDIKHYHSSDKDLIANIINDENLKKVLDFFDSIGIIPRIKDGYYYPYSNTAVTIQNTLLEECKRLQVQINTSIVVKDILKEEDGFIIITNKGKYNCDKVVVAIGSNASLKDDIKIFDIIKNNHNFEEFLPALSRINLDFNYLKEWSGIRNSVVEKIIVDDELIKEESGEILYTNNGISGIVTMQLSNIASKALKDNKKVDILINNMNNFCNTRQEFIDLLNERNRKYPNRSISALLDTYMDYKLVNILMKTVGINYNEKWDNLSERDKNILASSFVDLRLNVKSTDPINKSQTVSGGVKLTDINLETMESKNIEGLYFTGEIIDLYGDCGGYNLTIAWSTGLLVK